MLSVQLGDLQSSLMIAQHVNDLIPGKRPYDKAHLPLGS